MVWNGGPMNTGMHPVKKASLRLRLACVFPLITRQNTEFSLWRVTWSFLSWAWECCKSSAQWSMTSGLVAFRLSTCVTILLNINIIMHNCHPIQDEIEVDWLICRGDSALAWSCELKQCQVTIFSFKMLATAANICQGFKALTADAWTFLQNVAFLWICVPARVQLHLLEENCRCCSQSSQHRWKSSRLLGAVSNLDSHTDFWHTSHRRRPCTAALWVMAAASQPQLLACDCWLNMALEAQWGHYWSPEHSALFETVVKRWDAEDCHMIFLIILLC